jgi:exopolysaccharide biosynthesis polyprenyl glycosylphosphotransferase
MKRKARLFFTTSLFIVDVSSMILAFFLAYKLRQGIPLPKPLVNIGPFQSYLRMMAVQIFAMTIVFFFYKLYHRERAQIDEFYTIFGAVSVGTVLTIALSSFLFKNRIPELDYSRGMVIYAWGLTIAFVSIGRFLHSRLQRILQARGWGEERVLIVGTGEVGRMLLQKIRHSAGPGHKVIGFVDDYYDEKTVMGFPLLGKVAELPSIIEEHRIDEVIVGLPEASHQEMLNIISLCERGRVRIKVFPDVFQIMASEVSIGDLGGLPLLTVRDMALRGWRLTIKRAMDIIGAAIGLIFLSPLMLLMAFLIKLDSPGPVFYVQERMGLDGMPFMIIKFRSMRKDAEAETGPVWAKKEDPRRTRLGRFIRRLSIDELPQLINVLLGEMSLVGPRPERPVFVEQFRRSIPRYMERHRLKAGMTGWAQINGLRGDTSIAERTKYDLWYIENWSLLLDFKILVRTFLNIFTDKNAY